MDIHEDDLNEIRKDLADMEAEQEAEYDQWIAQELEHYEPTCPICDAYGCGGDGLGCYQYEGRGEISDPRDFDPVF